MVHNAATAFPQNSLAMRVIDHGHQVEFLCYLHKLVEGGIIAIHREYTIANDQTATVRASSFLDNPPEIRWVTVRVAVNLGAGETRPIDNGSMVELI